MDQNKSVKILFRLFSTILDEIAVETMWAQTVDEEKGLYKLVSIPFHLPLIACDDIVLAEYDEDEGMLTYRKIIEYSGNSTVHVMLMDDTAGIDNVRKVFDDLGCASEKYSERYFAMDIPAGVDYSIIRSKLEELETAEMIDYSESSLSEQHQY
jgi:hypothetical protein